MALDNNIDVLWDYRLSCNIVDYFTKFNVTFLHYLQQKKIFPSYGEEEESETIV